MKKLLFCLFLICGTAQAEILAFLQNQAGGIMYFTDATCSRMGKPWKVLYSTYSGGQTTWGCWIYADGMVHVSWSNGNTSAFNASDLTLNTKRQNNL